MSPFDQPYEGQEIFLKNPLQIYAKVVGPLPEDLGSPLEQVRYAVRLLPLEQYYLAQDLEPAQRPQFEPSSGEAVNPEPVESPAPLNEVPQNASPGDPFFDLTQEIDNQIAARAFEFYADRGFAHGFDTEDWLRAEAEILQYVPTEIVETESELTIRAAVPGLTEKDLEVRVAPHSVCVTGKKVERLGQRENAPNRIFLVLDLPSEIDTASVKASLDGGVLEIGLLKTGVRKVVPVRAKSASA